MSKNKPIKNFRSANMQASIWKNEKQQGQETKIRYSVKITKSIKQNGEYRDTNYFFDNDLPRLAKLADKAYEFLTVREEEPENENN